AAYVRALNRGLTRQAFITVYVYEVELNREDNYGLDLALAFKSAGLDSGFSAQGPGIPPETGTVTPGALGMSVVSGPWAKSQALLQALSTQGKTSLVTSASVLALNGQPAPLQVATTTGYLYSSTVTQAANVGSSVSLTPGTITTGFAANFLPMIMSHRRLLLEYAVNLSDLLALNTVSSGGNEIQTPDRFHTSVLPARPA
ncbi:type IVB pilus formation outer membrane protein, R64 PilN family, partial [mine drainage metagenome]